MSGSSALQGLAEKVSRLCSEYRHLRKRCEELEKQVKKLERKSMAAAEKGGRGKKKTRALHDTGTRLNKDLLKAKVEEMLAELADIG